MTTTFPTGTSRILRPRFSWRGVRCRLMASGASLWITRCLLGCLLFLGANTVSQGAFVTTGDIIFSEELGAAAVGGSYHGSTTVSGVTFTLDAIADLGTFTITNTSRLQAEFPTVLASPGNATINISQIPIASSVLRRQGLVGEIGLQVSFFSPSVGFGFGVESTGMGDGTLGTIIGEGSGLAQPAPSFGIPFVLEVGATPALDYKDTIDFDQLSGRLLVQYTDPTGTRTDYTTEFFDITSSGMPGEVNIPLNFPGTYDFGLATPSITGTYDSLSVASISVFGEIFGNNISLFGIPVDSERRTGDFKAESPFGFFIENWFSIEVQQQQPSVVPEPSTWITGVTGLTFLAVGAFWHRRRLPIATAAKNACQTAGIFR